MSNIRYLTAGESHGKGLTTIIEGIPSNLKLTAEFINMELSRRQLGYGRGGRMKIEKDSVEILSGIRHGSTIGSPVTLFIENKDWENWKEVMSAELPHPLPNPPLEGEGISPLLQGFIPGAVEGQGEGGVHSELRTPNSKIAPITRPRPGHADLSGAIKYNQRDIRNILERSSARETAARVAVGAVAKSLLGEFGIKIYSWVTEIGEARGQVPGVREELASGSWRLEPVSSSIYYSSHSTPHTALSELFDKAEKSEVRCPVATLTEAIKKRIDAAREKGDSLGGVFEIVVSGVPAGLGSHVQWDRKLNARLAMSIMSIQAIKGVEIGLGFEAARRPGSEVHDEIFYSGQGSVVRGQESAKIRGQGPGARGQVSGVRKDLEPGTWKLEPEGEPGSWNLGAGFHRNTNNAGGIEGGMSNGEDIVLRAAMKPIPTLYKPLRSVDIETKEAFEASIERSDICAVPAASVVGEAVVAIEIANAMLDKFGGDSMEEVKRNYDSYMEYVRKY